jgi:hypothetical protein
LVALFIERNELESGYLRNYLVDIWLLHCRSSHRVSKVVVLECIPAETNDGWRQENEIEST